ncbi:MAG TPA: hypothetical protein VLH08_21385 [Acidobacteriota bacterium]|nr:hypothetical protein [Acidobacteriota bacterium]
MQRTLDPQNDGIDVPVDGATIVTGDGDDAVFVEGSRMKIDTGRGNDQVQTVGDENVVTVGEGNDWVKSMGDRNQINTGGQEQDFATAQGNDNLVDGKEPEIPDFPPLKW